MVRRSILLALVLVAGCATLKRSLTTDPQTAPNTTPLVGFSYDPARRTLTIYPEAADDLVVCLPPTFIRYQSRARACDDLRDLRSYIRALTPATP